MFTMRSKVNQSPMLMFLCPGAARAELLGTHTNVHVPPSLFTRLTVRIARSWMHLKIGFQNVKQILSHPFLELHLLSSTNICR
jgi:hypothetical protein